MLEFNVDDFLTQTVEDAGQTALRICPEGTFTAMIKDIKIDQFRGKKDPSKVYTKASLRWTVEDAEVKAELHRDNIVVFQDIFIDLDVNGKIDVSEDKNIALWRVRDALGQNVPHQKWTPSMMLGSVAVITVVHELVNDSVVARVGKVTPF
jgi:hypothetical protein